MPLLFCCTRVKCEGGIWRGTVVVRRNKMGSVIEKKHAVVLNADNLPKRNPIFIDILHNIID